MLQRILTLMIGASLLLFSAAWAADTSAYPSQSKASVTAKLKAKGKIPWIEREKGMGVITLKNGGMMSEDFFPLDAWEAASPMDLRDSVPRFAEGFDQQQGKADAISRALESTLKQLPYGFRALAGNGRVDKVQLQADGRDAYVFIIPMDKNFIAFSPDKTHFYYQIPAVLGTLEGFIQSRSELDRVIWLDRGEGYFMFVVQRKK